MEEARRVLARLERIEALERDRAQPRVVLAELRLLLDEAEAWTRADRGAGAGAVEAVRTCRQMLEDTSRTLLA
jgi:Tfp pilus assembly protein PilN